uniref:Uncharacterized protein n=1 Tax=Kalanchoe fedtschenkoi TaxID=63787 RepID=A0A7N0ZYA0_KALFE
MAVDSKVIRVYLWRFSVLFAGICYRFAQKHPCISGTFLSLSVLYVFFPLVFRLLIYSSPIMVCAYAYRKNVVKSEHPEARVQKKDDLTKDAERDLVRIDGYVLAEKKYANSSMQNKRIHVKEERSELHDMRSQFDTAASGNAQDHEYGNLKKAVRDSESDILGKAENDLKKAKEECGKAENTENEDDGSRKANGESESDILDKAEYEDDEETQEEDAHEDTRKAVEWTEQDEKNLMDLGTSETERDRRLESLIQKRRARKLLSMQVRNVIDIIRHTPNQVAPLVIARSTGPFNLINTLSDTDDLHMPGSAPSILLPSRSPFDLPYDPFEERPNLTGDSFEQEFITPDHKDFCRHESFCLGGPFGPRQDGNSLNSFMKKEKIGMERHGFSRFRSYNERGSYESLSPGASDLEHELMSRDDILVHDSGYKAGPLKQPSKSDNATSENNVQSQENIERCESATRNADSSERCGTEGPVEGDSVDSGENVTVEAPKADSDKNMSSEDLSSYLRKSLASSMQEISVKEADENGHAQLPVYISSKDLFNVHKRVRHTPAHSIASDLVVEVSETGSPPQPLSPPDGDSSQYDGDVDRGYSSGSEDISMHVYKTEEQETRDSEEHASGKGGLAPGESIPDAVELEQDLVDEYEHTSQTSSDDDSSYENVVQHLTEKLKARALGNTNVMRIPEEPPNPAEVVSGVEISSILANQTNPISGIIECSEKNDSNSTATCQHETSELSGPAAAESTAIASEKHYEQETGLDIGTSGSKELGEDLRKHDYGSFEATAFPAERQASSNLEVSEDVHEGIEMRSSDEVSAALQAQAVEELAEATTSPKSVLPDSDFRDEIARVESQPSDVADSLSDVTQPENSIPSVAENQSAQHVESQDLRSSPSKTNIVQGDRDMGEASKSSSFEDNTEASVIHTIDEETRNVELKPGIAAEISLTANAEEETAPVSEVENAAPGSERVEGTIPNSPEGNHEALQGGKLSTAMDPVPETGDLEFTKDEEVPVLTDNQADSLVGFSGSTEALPLSDNIIADEFHGSTETSPDTNGSASDADALRNSSEPLVKVESQNDAPITDVDTELHIHHITEACM